MFWRAPGGGTRPRLPPDAHLATAGRPRSRAEAAEPHLLPDFGRRARGGAGRGGDGVAQRVRLVLSLLPRPRSVSHPWCHAARDVATGCGRGGGPREWRAPDAVALGPSRLA